MANIEKQRLVILISGSGTTMNEIIDATKDGRLPRTEVVAVIASKPAKGIQKAIDQGIPKQNITIVDPMFYSSREAYGDSLLDELCQRSPDVIGQYGHEPLTPSNVIDRFPRIMINQHPGPIDPGPYDFGGEGMSNALRVHAARLIFVRETRRNRWTDVVAQRVAATFDGGKVLKRGRVPILPHDTVETLQQRAIRVEWQTQIDTLRDFEESTVSELPPYEDLVLPGERMLLQSIKRLVKYLYPN